MESFYYNPEQKEVYIVLGYGIANHLSLNFLTETVNDIKNLFPLLTDSQANEMKFFEVDRKSRRHRNMFYTHFPYEFATESTNSSYVGLVNGIQIFVCNKHVKGVDGWEYPDESCAELVQRMIHD